MRLIVHNMLSCNIKGVVNKFPLLIEAEKVIEKEIDFNPEFLKYMLAKIDWKALVEGARSLGYTELPNEAPETEALESDESFLRKFHHALLELHLEEGSLVCPETGRKFTVSKGIPNMLLHEDEVEFNNVIYVRTIMQTWGKLGKSPVYKAGIPPLSVFMKPIAKESSAFLPVCI